MPVAPDIATIAGLIGDRARAAILVSLMGGRALTATELARAAGVTKQTVSSHLSKLADARLIAVEHSGRHRYFRLGDYEVGRAIECLAGLAHRIGALQVETGPADIALRKARVCYDHLAGDLGVLIMDSLVQQGCLRSVENTLILTEDGERLFEAAAIDVATLKRGRRALCLACLDWSARRHHLAGALGAAILDQCLALGWARRARDTRSIIFSVDGERSLRERFTYREQRFTSR